MTNEGNLITIRVTGFGNGEGPLMTRAKARAIATSKFGRDQASSTKTTDVDGAWKDEKEEVFADKSDGLFTGPISGVRDRLKTFRKDGLFAEVKDISESKPEYSFSEGKLEEEFGVMAGSVRTFRYKILVTTSYALGA